MSFSDRARQISARLVGRIAEGFVRLRITANGLTVTGALLASASAILAAQGQNTQAAILFVLGSAFDGIDGAVARAQGRISRFGALLDSTLDRYSETLLLMGIGIWLARSGNLLGLTLTFLTVLGSVMVSYTRARSEGLGIENKGGLLTRFERIIILGLALLTGWIMPGLWLLTILTHFTVAQRLWRVYRAELGESQLDMKTK